MLPFHAHIGAVVGLVGLSITQGFIFCKILWLGGDGAAGEIN